MEMYGFLFSFEKISQMSQERSDPTPIEFCGAVGGRHILKYNCSLSLGKIHLLKITVTIGHKILLNLILRVKMESFEISFVALKLCSYLKENLNLHFSFIARVSVHFI